MSNGDAEQKEFERLDRDARNEGRNGPAQDRLNQWLRELLSAKAEAGLAPELEPTVDDLK